MYTVGPNAAQVCVCVSVCVKVDGEKIAEEEESVEAKVSIPPLVFFSFFVLRSSL